MNPHRITFHLVSVCLILTSLSNASAQKQKIPPGGRVAIVVDERLSALRATPELTGKLVRRLGRGRLVAIKGVRTSRDGIVFFSVNVTSRTKGWLQREAVVSPSRIGDDERLVWLIKSSTDFDRIVRARIFLDHFPRSSLRPEVLLLLGDAAASAAVKLTRDADRRIGEIKFGASSSYFLNYVGLDRYNRQGVVFDFDQPSGQLVYDGAAWREIIRRYPRSPEAVEARKRLIASQQ